MAVIATFVAIGILKGLAKLAVQAADGGVIAEALATEFAGATAKQAVERAIESLVKQQVGSVENHPEFRGIAPNDVEAVRDEVERSLAPALNRAFLAAAGYQHQATVTEIYRGRGHSGEPFGKFTAQTMLYQQSLEAAVSAVIIVAEGTKEWHADNARSMHTKLDDLVAEVEAAANRHTQILSVLSFTQMSIADLRTEKYRKRHAFLDRYYLAIRKTLDRMELYGLDVKEGNPARSQRLSAAYISLNLTAKGSGASAGSLRWEAILDTLAPGDMSRLLVRGDAGMGKTTLLRWAAIALASQSGGGREELIRPDRQFTDDTASTEGARMIMRDGKPCDIANPWRGKVPLLVILRECPGGTFPKPHEFPSFVDNIVGVPPSGFIEELLNQGKALVMIDGLDEVPTGEPFKQVTKSITALVRTDGDAGNLFIATSRPLVEDPAWITQLKFREAVIAPMTDPERNELIGKWHRAVADETADLDAKAKIEEMANELIKQLNQRPAIARVATVPLLCAMICAQSGPLGSRLPESEFAIINKLAEAMLWVRDRDKGVPPTGTPWDDLKEDKRWAVASRLAHLFISKGEAAIARDSAEKAIADGLRYAGRSQAQATADAPSVLNRMSESGGVVKAPAGGLVEFAHKTFCEFLSAFQFVEDQITTFLADHAPEPGPANVCRFTSGVKNRKWTEELIGKVIDGKENKEARAVIALRMALAAPSLGPYTQDRVKEIEARVVPPHSPAEALAIADLGDEVVKHLGYTPGMEVSQQVMNAMALSQIRSEDAIKALAAYAPGAENLTLIEQLCRGLSPLTIPLVRRALTEPEDRLRPSLNNTIRSQITDAAIKAWLRTDSALASLTTLDLSYTQITDAGAAALASKDSGLKALTTLDLSHTKITNAGAAALAAKDSGLKALTTLDLSYTQITDAGAAALAAKDSGLKALTSLYLSDTQITDEGAAALAAKDSGLKALTTLDLSYTKITDAGAAALAAKDSGLKALTTLALYSTKITDAGAAVIQARFPRITIRR